MSVGAPLAIGVALLVAQAPARAAPRFELRWEAPPCAQAPSVSQLLGEDAAGHARVVISEEAQGFGLEVVFLAPNPGRRVLTLSSCAEAARAASLLLRLGATAALGEPDATVAPPPAPEAEAMRVGLAATVGTEVATFSTAPPRLGASLSLGKGGVAAGLDLHAGLPSRVAFGPNPAAAVGLHDLAEAQAFACAEIQRGRFEAGPCAALTGAVWEIGGVNVVSPMTRLAPVFSVSAQLRAAFEPAPHVWIGAMTGLALHLVRPRIGFDGYGAVLEAAPWGAQFQLAAGWRG